MAALQVTEIVRRLDQGMTGPYLVRAEDGELYVAKGKGATKRGLMVEWICAHLARRIGLSIPDFTFLEVPQELLDALATGATSLGAGIAFGSRQEVSVQEFAITQLERVPSDQRRLLLTFDWWIENGDRSLSPHGGNPNLLWRASDRRLLVIDHNLAFNAGADFDKGKFFSTHVFRADADAAFYDLVNRIELSTRLHSASACFDTALAAIPEPWKWVDAECTIPVQVDWSAVRNRLVQRAELTRGCPV